MPRGRPETQDWDRMQWDRLEQQCSHNGTCTTSGGVVVKAKKGDAIFWWECLSQGLQVLTTLCIQV